MEIFTGPITIQQILLYNNNWLNFIKLHKNQIRDVVYENINKILNCRKGLGYSLYTCPVCGKQEKVMHSCKSRICSSCGKAAQDKWLSKTLSEMLPVSYKHIIFTLPEQLRKLFLTHRDEMLNIFFKSSAKSIINIVHREFHFTPGIIAVSHSFGNDLKSNFHMHLIVSSGGISTSDDKWINQAYIPENLLKPEFKILMLQTLRQLHKSGKFFFKGNKSKFMLYSVFNKFLDSIYNISWYLSIGRSLKDASFAVKYVTRYTKKPVIATSRIISFKDNIVTFKYKDHATNSFKTISLSALDFIGRFIRHIPERYFHQIRYYGLFANRTKKSNIAKALKLLGKTVSISKIFNNFKERFLTSFGFDRLFCKKCNCNMVFSGFYLPKYERLLC